MSAPGNESRRPRARIVYLVMVPVLLVAVVAGFWLGSGLRGSGRASHANQADQTARSGGQSPLGNKPAPDFTLTDQFGGRVSLHQFRGKAILLAFVDSECTTICPLTTSMMVQAVTDLGPAGSRVQLLGIDANPLATTVGDVRAYSASHGMLTRWRFLTGSPAELRAVWKAYHVYVAAVHNNIDHEPVIYVIDPKGREKALFWTPMDYASVGTQGHQLAAATAAALGLAAPPKTSGPPTSDVLPSRSIALPVVAGPGAGTKVRLGPGHPHLVVFVASWVQQVSNLAGRLEALNRYARLAAKRGWPSPVAVDLATVEPSPDALQRLLTAQHVRLDFPLVQDQTGGLADGYQVKDAPWLALTSSAGKVVWSHEGWLSRTALQAAVRAKAG